MHTEHSDYADGQKGAKPQDLVRLHFTIRKAATAAELLQALQLRHDGSATEARACAGAFRKPEPIAITDDGVVLKAECRSDGRAIGSMRIQQNMRRLLNLATGLQLPTWLDGQRLAVASHLSVEQGTHADTVRLGMFKAHFLSGQQQQAAWLVAVVPEAMVRLYRHLMFRDIMDGATFKISPELDVPHQVLALETDSVQARWKQARHPLLGFVFGTVHPDIDINGGAAVLQPSL